MDSMNMQDNDLNFSEKSKNPTSESEYSNNILRKVPLADKLEIVDKANRNQSINSNNHDNILQRLSYVKKTGAAS